MKRNYCVQCFRYSCESSELWRQEYFETLSCALEFVVFYAAAFDSVQIFKVK